VFFVKADDILMPKMVESTNTVAMKYHRELRVPKSFVDDGNVTCGFVAYLGLAADPKTPAKCRAISWSYMGDLASPHPDFELGGIGTGYFYYCRAIELDPECISAWCGIVREYSDRDPGHRDTMLYHPGMEFLDDNCNALSPNEQRQFEEAKQRRK
jgi:hypothetical protein